MPGFDHRPPGPSTIEDATSGVRAKLGRRLFLLYVLFYAGFVLISAFAPDQMSQVVAGGINLAVVYGLALIAIAFVLAVVYDIQCRIADKRKGSA